MADDRLSQLDLDASEDLAALSTLDEDILLTELKKRYEKDKIYTYIGDILVAVNPFRDLGIYGAEYTTLYQHTKRGQHPPHIYAVADMTYQSMLGLRAAPPKNQCILISGESGAGKTENTKLQIKHLVELCHGNSQLGQQIIQVNPLMEAFGNAQTLMNDNSSRFGRYIMLKFYNGNVIGSKISEYLLEKSRVVHQNEGEQNFHVFYYMFAGEGQKDRLQQAESSWSWLSGLSYLPDGAEVLEKNCTSFKEKYEELIYAMDIVGFTQQEQNDMFSLLNGILSIGNIAIEGNDLGEGQINKTGQLNTTAKLLGLSAEDMKEVLTCNVTYLQGEQIVRNYRKEQAIDGRDAMAKAIYGRLFSWIVHKVNTLLAPTEDTPQHKQTEIGILDIFGFEVFERNSFEQACINLANEQLQFFFNKHIFLLEQEEYRREGIDWKEIKYVDNGELLSMFLDRPIGIMALLDEESQFPRGTDRTFVDKLNERFGDNPSYQKMVSAKVPSFTIIHYAGEVKYDASGWLEKNRDTLSLSISQLLRESENALLSTIFKGEISRTGTLSLQHRSRRSSKMTALKAAMSTKKAKTTVGGQFKNSLKVLMERMTQCQPVFIRCIKPNRAKSPRLFQDDYVTAQLLYTGMLETTKIRREGFPIRPTFDEFIRKYKIIATERDVSPTADSCREILDKCGLDGYCIGRTKVFLKYWHSDHLTAQLDKLGRVVTIIQRWMRGFRARRQVAAMREASRDQARQVQALLQDVQARGQSWLQKQHEKKEHDKSIPRDYFKAPGSKQVPDDLVKFETLRIKEKEEKPDVGKVWTNRAEGEEGVSDDDILEDIIPPRRPDPSLTEFGKEGTKPAAIKWFNKTQRQKLVHPDDNVLPEWFHGIIPRREAETLLKKCPIGYYLIRVAESRFGYSLSFKSPEKIRHYMIEQTRSGKYIVIGEPRTHSALQSLVDYYCVHCLSNWDKTLTEPCGQREGECDYADLVSFESASIRSAAVPHHGAVKPGTFPQFVGNNPSKASSGRRAVPPRPNSLVPDNIPPTITAPHPAYLTNNRNGATDTLTLEEPGLTPAVPPRKKMSQSRRKLPPPK